MTKWLASSNDAKRKDISDATPSNIPTTTTTPNPNKENFNKTLMPLKPGMADCATLLLRACVLNTHCYEMEVKSIQARLTNERFATLYKNKFPSLTPKREKKFLALSLGKNSQLTNPKDWEKKYPLPNLER
ncbi:unnamed protein product [Phytomonas sp. Hart1]|nr:unnamed protein product [Phytomonas sp. Hart1]|eukprot:CCW71199.1 unnamed protein product [Phytomonas sp. isolate Hart1]